MQYIVYYRMVTIIKLIKKLLRKNRTKHKPIDASYIIPRSHHSLSKADISPNALKVLNRLNSGGYQACLVGGSVRDLLLGKIPKDFDIATNATPQQVKKLLSNARIIGRRFKLVHIIFYREIIEVATFRGHLESPEPSNHHQTNESGMLIRDNNYGTIEQDAWRRDFTINSLYYNIDDASIVDFTKGIEDVHNKTIRIIGSPSVRYQEDPVRMLRAVRFAAKLHFAISPETAEPIKKLNHLILGVSSSRLFDEVTKLFQCGEAKEVLNLLLEHGLFQHLFPQTHELFDSEYPIKELIDIALENTDARVHDGKPITPAFLLAILLWFPLKDCAAHIQAEESLAPLPALEKAMSLIIAKQNKIISTPKHFTQIIREIWLLQFRFSKRTGNRAFNLLEHSRFRAAYDFMALRALAGDESINLAQWWNNFQECSEEERLNMIQKIPKIKGNKKVRRYKKKTNPPIIVND